MGRPKVEVQIVDRDHGAKRLLREVRLTGAVVEVGIVGSKAAAPSKKSPTVTVLQLGTWGEFGTERQPARAPISKTFDANRDSNLAFARTLHHQRLAGKLTYDKQLSLIGLRAVGQIQKTIAEGLEPPNAPSTIRRKGSSKPLIDTGQLRSSYSFRVVK